MGNPHCSVLEVLHPVKGTCVFEVCEEMQTMGGTHIGELCRTVSCGREPMLEQGMSVKRPPPEEEELVDKICDGLTANPISNPRYTTSGRRRWRESGVKLSL